MKILRNRNLTCEIGIFLLGLCGSLYVALTPANSMMNWYSSDDAFYYFKVAQNVVTGHGFTFDQINLTNGFHPLWMVICLGVFWLTRYGLLLPLRVLILVSGVLNGLTGIFLFRLLKKAIHPAAAILGAVAWIMLPSVYNVTAVHGMEAVISAFFLVVFLSYCLDFIQIDRPKTGRFMHLAITGVLAGLTILSRLDNVFVVFVVGMFMILKIRRMNRLLIFDLIAILFAAVGAWILRFGTASYELNRYSMYPLLLVALVIKPILLFFCGFYSSSIKNRLGMFILRFGIAGVVILILEYGLMHLALLLGFNLLISRSVIVLDVILSLAVIFIIRLFYFPKIDELQPQDSSWTIFKNWVAHDLGRIVINGLTFAAPVALLLGIYAVINKLMFGTFTPVSGQIKSWWGTLTNTIYSSQSNLVELLGLSPNSAKGPWSILTSLIAKAAILIQKIFNPNAEDFPTRWFLLLTFLVFILLVFLLSRKKGYLARKSFTLLLPALIIGCFCQITYYTARSYSHTRYWYWVTENLVLVLLGAVFSSRLFEKFKEWTKSELLNNILLLLGILTLIFMHTRFIVHLAPEKVAPEHAADYLASTRELEKYTTEGSLIGMTGGGTTAYFIENRTIVNMDGLINSVEYFQALKTGTAAQFLDNLPLDYVYGKPYTLLETEPYDKIFKNRLQEIGYIQGSDAFTLFRYLSVR